MISLPSENKPASLKGILWLAFSATAMLSAFILPIHIFAFLNPGTAMRMESLLFRIYFFVLLISALYHGLYRTKTILFDLGLGKYQKIIGGILTILFLIFSGMSAYLLFL